MKFLHKLLVFALLFVGVITQASAESFTVNGVVYRITDTGVAVNNLAIDNDLNGIVYVPEEVQYGSTTYKREFEIIFKKVKSRKTSNLQRVAIKWSPVKIM